MFTSVYKAGLNTKSKIVIFGNSDNKTHSLFSLIKKEIRRSLNVELGLVCQERLIRFASLSARVLSHTQACAEYKADTDK